jgi:hypothetical protein
MVTGKGTDMEIGDKIYETNEYRPLYACPKEEKKKNNERESLAMRTRANLI